MEPLQKFELQGTTYYQQYRKCNKPTCRACANGAGHGPYWFRRDGLGQVKYLGKHLPPEVATARVNKEYAQEKLVELRRELFKKYEVVTKHLRSKALTAEEQQLIYELGFGNTLLPAAGSTGTEEEDQP